MKSILSIAIVTHNRQLKLYKCLNGLVRQTEKPLEVLVIDNDSSDRTREVILSFADKLPVRHVVETKPGIPFARNRALKEAKGKILAFIDDDCVPISSWTKEMLRAHLKNIEAIAIQGKSICRPLDSLFGMFSHIAHELTIKRNLILGNNLLYLDTKNVSFKMQALRRYKLRFNNNLLRGSDVDFSKQILFHGGKILFYPRAKIYFSPREDLFSFLIQRFRWGKANIMIENAYPKKYFAQQPKLSMLKHPLINKYWYKKFFLLVLINLAFMAEKFGRKVNKYQFQYRELGYRNKLRLPYKTPKSYRTITIAIITCNRPELLKLSLDSIVTQTRKPDEVLIIDSSDNNKSLELVTKFKSKIKNLIHVPMLKKGRGAARNLALDLATQDLLAFMDDDIEADSLWVAQMLIGHNKYRKPIAIQGRILSKIGNSPWALVEQYRMDKWFIEKMNRDNTMQIITTKNVSFKLKRINKLKLRFIEHPNPEFANMIGEDVDFAKRLLNVGQSVHYLSSALVYHNERGSLRAFLKQQYRKGYSYWLNKKNWAKYYNNPGKTSIFWLINDRLFASISDMLFHPVLKGKFAKFPLLIFIYYLSVAVYFKGFIDSLRVNQSLETLLRIEKPKFIFKEITIAIISCNQTGKLKRLFTSLVNQQAYPKEILVIDNDSSGNVFRLVDSFRSLLPIRYLYESSVNKAFVCNRALRNTQTNLITFLDEDCVLPPDWLKSIHQGYLKYSYAVAIQGWPISSPSNLPVSIISRFNRQAWFRDNMPDSRDKFWDLISGRIQNRIDLLSCDDHNVCFNIRILNKYGIRFERKRIDGGSSYYLAKQLRKHKLDIVFWPVSKMYLYEKANWISFLKQCYEKGRILKIKRNYFKKFAAFVYFSFKNKYYLKLPLLIMLFTLSEVAYGFGNNIQPAKPRDKFAN